MYSRPGEQNCPVSSMDLYLGKLNLKCKAFFQQYLQYPKQECWYAAQAMGKNKLASMMSRISKNANMSRRYTNHCITATVATVLKRQGVDLLSIMSVTGHRNMKSLNSYINRPTDHERRMVSSALQEGTMPVSCNSSVETLTLKSVQAVAASGSFSSATSSFEMSVSREQLSNSANNILNNATITSGSFTFNVFHKDNN